MTLGARLAAVVNRVLAGLDRLLLPAGLAFALVVLHLGFRHPYPSGDSGHVARAAQPILTCLRAGKLTGCPNVTHFPPLQMLVTTAATWVGFKPEPEAYNLLTELNLLAFAWVLWATWRFFRERRSARGWLALAVLLGSFAVNYAVTPFGEMLAVALGTGLVLSALRGRAGWAALCAFGLGLTKEVATPLAAALGVAALSVEADTWRGWLVRRWRGGAVIVAGSLLGWGAAGLFNLFRYGTIVNAHLLSPNFRVDSWGQRLLHLAGLFASPGAGLLVAAPTAVLVLVVVALQAGRAPGTPWRGPAAVQRWWPLAFTLLVSAGLATWFTPFGWWAWGPRLSLPWLVPAVLLAIAVAPPGAFEGRWRLVLWALAPAALLNAAHLAEPEAMFHYFQRTVCLAPIGSPSFYECANGLVFALDGLAASVVREALAKPLVKVVAVLHLVVVLGLLARWRRLADAPELAPTAPPS